METFSIDSALGALITVRSRSRSSHVPGALFKYLYHCRGGNDNRELRKFSTQLDMLIEKPWFKSKVHIGADGGTMHGGWLRSVSLPGYTLMAFFFLPFPPRFPQVWVPVAQSSQRLTSGWRYPWQSWYNCKFPHSYIIFQVWCIYYTFV